MGAKHFTTNRVAEATGVSIGSLYQYYPNKAVLLVELHTRDAQRLWEALRTQLFEATLSPRERFEHVIRACFEAQAGAQEHHLALTGAQANVGSSVEFQLLEQQVTAELEAFLDSCLPELGPRSAELARFTVAIVRALLERMPADPHTDWQKVAADTATMLADYVGL